MSGILIIEDEKHIRENVKEILELNGHDVLSASNGIEGLTMAYQFHPELIICDIMMPGMDGYKVLNEVRNSTLDYIPFIFLTAKSERSDERKGMESGADDYITKPFTSTDLINGVKSQICKQQERLASTEYKIRSQRLSLTDQYNSTYVRNHLNTVIGLTSALEHSFEGHLNEEQKKMFSLISHAGHSVFRYIRNLHCHEQINMYQEKIVDIYGIQPSHSAHVIMKRSYLIAGEYHRESDLRLKIDDIEFPLSEYTLTYIIDELLFNAFRFTEKGTPITVEFSQNNDNVFLRVTDTGNGCNASTEDIQPFNTFDFQPEYPSSGLGLSNIKYITNANNVEFIFVAASGAGCSVSIHFKPLL